MRISIAALAIATSFLLGSAANANIVTNPGFETGDFTGWTQGGDTSFTGVDGNPHSGNFAAFFGPVDSIGTLSQTLTTTPGELYNIDFWLENDDTSGVNSFSVSFDGNVLDSMTGASAFGYTEFSFTALASTSSTVRSAGTCSVRPERCKCSSKGFESTGGCAG